jgi:hypothetical protein
MGDTSSVDVVVAIMTTPSGIVTPERRADDAAYTALRPRIVDCLRCVLFNVIFFAVVAPPLGGIVFMTYMGVFGGIRLTEILFSLPLVIFLGYAWFGLTAAVTGAVVASASIWISRSLPLYILAGMAGAIGAGIWIVRLDPAEVSSFPWSNAFILILSGVFAAGICTRIARPFRFDGTEMSDLFKRSPSEAS